MPKEATNEINHDPLFLPSEAKVGESRAGQDVNLKVAYLENLERVDFEKIDFEKVDFGKVNCKELLEQDKETEDGKDQVSESSESLSQVRIMMRKRLMIMAMAMMIMMMMTKSWCCISASCTNNAFMVVTGSC